MQPVRFILDTNLWVALAAPSVLWAHALFVRREFPAEMYALVFSGVLFTYNLQRLYGANKFLSPELLPRHKRILENQDLFWAVTLSGGVVAAITARHMPAEFIIRLIPAAILSALYVLPVFPGRRRLRDVPLIKIPIVAFTWAWVLVIAPAETLPPHVLALFFYQCMLFFGLTIPFDLRDLEHDRMAGTVTWVSRYGTAKAKGLALISVSGSVLPFLWETEIHEALPFFIISGLAAFAVLGVKKTRKEWYYGILLDGIIILQGPALYVFRNIQD